jgi:predicted MPP superfamily phosphohydrolase
VKDAPTQTHATCSPLLGRRSLLRAAGLLGVGLPAAAATDAFLVTPGWLTQTQLTIGQETIAGGDSARRAGPTTLVQLSDLHLKRIGRLEERVLEILTTDPPDLLLFTGDAFDTAAGLDVFAEFLRSCPRGAVPLGILGNWEHRTGVPQERISKLYEQNGGRLLVNHTTSVETAGGSLQVTGLDDLVGGSPRHEQLEDQEKTGPHLLLAHCPAHRDLLGPRARDQVDLLLAGHTHGGQIAPFGIALVTPAGSGPYVAGWYREQAAAMYVSRGLGTSLIPARLGVAPELVTIRWTLT